MPMTINRTDTAQRFAKALVSNDEKLIAEAWTDCSNEIASHVIEMSEELKGVTDEAVLASRGVRQLTSSENKWYEKLIDAARGPKQAFIDLFADAGSDDFMPETIIEDVFKHIEQDHPIISRVDFQYVGYSTKWIIDDSAVQKGAWGKVNAKVTEEIEGGLKVLDLTQKKYTAFVILPLAIIDLGPAWIDSYVRAVLYEAIAAGIEDAIVNGTGKDMPCGLTCDPNGEYNQGTGYPKLAEVKVKSFAPAEYGALVAKLAKTEKGRDRSFPKVQLLCNMTDYLTKVMPATTTITADGTGYAHDLFPFPTEAIVCNAVPTGKAVLCLLGEYTLAAGSHKNGATEYDDSIGFLDHTRAYRNVNYFDGRAYDKTCSVVLDISELSPAFITVKVEGGAAAAASLMSEPAGEEPEVA